MSLHLVPDPDDTVFAPDGVSAEAVILAALQLADLGGLDCITHHQLALIFGCTNESIHALYATRADLVDAMCERTMEELAFPSWFAGWQGWVHAVASSLHQLAMSKPGGVEALSLRPVPQVVIDAAHDAFAKTGLTEDLITDIGMSTWAAFIGLALAESHSAGSPWEWMTHTLIAGIERELPGSGAQIRMLPPV